MKRVPYSVGVVQTAFSTLKLRQRISYLSFCFAGQTLESNAVEGWEFWDGVT